MSLATGNFTDIQIKLLRKDRWKSLRAWAIGNRESVGSVYNAVKGRRNGEKARRIRSKLSKYLNE